MESTKPWAKNVDELIVLLLTASIFMPFYLNVAAVCAVAAMTMINCKTRAKAFSAPYSKFLLGFLVVPFFVSATYENYWGMLYAIVIVALVVCAFYVRSIMNRQLFNNIMDLSCIGSVWCTFIAIYQKAFAPTSTYRPISLFHNANCYGMMIEFIVIIAMYRIFTNGRNKKFYFAVIGLNLIGLYLSASVSSLVALVFAILVMLLLKGKYKILAGLALIGTAVFVCGVFFPAIFPRGIDTIDRTYSQRLSIWATALKGIEQNPILGTGAQSYQMICDKFGGYKTYHCHNLLLDTLLNYGFIGLGAIGTYVIMQMKLLVLRFRNKICNNMNILLAAGFTAVVVHGMTDVTILWIQTGLLFMLMFSSTGIGSAYLEKKLRLPSILPEYADDTVAQPLYLKN